MIQTGTSLHRAVLWLQAVCLSAGARIWLPCCSLSWGNPAFGLHLLGSAAPRGEALSCSLPTSSNSSLAVCLQCQGHLKATAGQPPPPCHTVSCTAWVPWCHQLALLSPPSQMDGRCPWAGRLCGTRGPGTCSYWASKCSCS